MFLIQQFVYTSTSLAHFFALFPREGESRLRGEGTLGNLLGRKNFLKRGNWRMRNASGSTSCDNLHSYYSNIFLGQVLRYSIGTHLTELGAYLDDFMCTDPCQISIYVAMVSKDACLLALITLPIHEMLTSVMTTLGSVQALYCILNATISGANMSIHKLQYYQTVMNVAWFRAFYTQKRNYTLCSLDVTWSETAMFSKL